MKFTNAELTVRMISDQKNGWPFCPRCGKLLKIDPQTQRAASSNALSREVVYISAMTAALTRLSARLRACPYRWKSGSRQD